MTKTMSFYLYAVLIFLLAVFILIFMSSILFVRSINSAHTQEHAQLISSSSLVMGKTTTAR